MSIEIYEEGEEKDFLPITIKDIIEDYYNFKLDSATRQRKYVEARAIYYYILRNKFNYSLSAIAKTLNKNHATVLHFTKQFDSWLMYDRVIRTDYQQIENRLNTAMTINPDAFKRSDSLEGFYEKEYRELIWKYNFLLTKLKEEGNKTAENPAFQLTND
jgi:hypothetical protein